MFHFKMFFFLLSLKRMNIFLHVLFLYKINGSLSRPEQIFDTYLLSLKNVFLL